MSVAKPSIKKLSDDFLRPFPGQGDQAGTQASQIKNISTKERNDPVLDFLRSSIREFTIPSIKEISSSLVPQKSVNNDDPWKYMLAVSDKGGNFGEGGERRTNGITNDQEIARALLATDIAGKKSSNTSDESKKDPLELMGINRDELDPNWHANGGAGSHSGDAEGSTVAGYDNEKADHGADAYMSWALSGAKSLDQMSLRDRVGMERDQSDRLFHYQDGQGIANIKYNASSGLSDRDWFELARTQGDQFIGLAYSQAAAQGQNISGQEARARASEMLGTRAQAYKEAGINDGNLIGILIGKGLSAEDFRNNPEEMARHQRYEQARSGSYDWSAMERELNQNGISGQEMRTLEQISGIDRSDQNLFAENLNYESYMNLHKLGNDLHYFKDKAIGFNLIFATNVAGDHNGALHMNHGSLTGLAADDKNPTIVLSPRSDEDMKRMMFRLAFVPKDASNVNGFEWLGRGLNQEESSMLKMLGNSSIPVQERIERFNQFLDDNGLEKNVGVANYMLKGHGWGGGIQLHDQGTYDNSDKDIMALMGLAISANVDEARIHQQSCSTAVGGENSNIGVGNNTMNDFAPSTTRVVSTGANAIHWNGQGEHYQNVSWKNGSMVNEGQITEKQYYERQGLNTQLRPEELRAMEQWTKDENGVIVRRESPSPSSESESPQLLAQNTSNDSARDEEER